MKLSEKLYLAGDTKKAALASTIAGNISKVRTKYNAGGQALVSERALAKQKEQKLTESTSNSEHDKEIYDVNFQQKYISKTQSDAINLAKDVITYVKNPLTFSQLEVKNKAVFLDEITTTHGVPYHSDYEKKKKKIETMSDSFLKMDLLYGNEAANIRTKGAKKLWDTLPKDEQKKVVSELTKIKSPLSIGSEKDIYKNKYVIELVEEIKKITK